MKTRWIFAALLLSASVTGWFGKAPAAENTPESKNEVKAAQTDFASIRLPKPQTTGGKPLMEALKDRKTSRAFSPKKLPLQILSNLLWVAWGVNREDGKRTAPSAMNNQEIDVYVTTAEGLYRYDAAEHTLVAVLQADIREATGRQRFVKDAPVNLVFVADYEKMGSIPDEQKAFYSAADTGYISQNVYLYCASEGLATVVRGMVDRPACREAMQLKPNQKIVLAQTVGYPPKSSER